MIDRKTLDLTCDDCGEGFDRAAGRNVVPSLFGGTVATDPQAALWDAAQQQGWRRFYRAEAWNHACPDCVAAFAQGQRRAKPKGGLV